MTKWRKGTKYPQKWAISDKPIPKEWNEKHSKYDKFRCFKLGQKASFTDRRKFNSASSAVYKRFKNTSYVFKCRWVQFDDLGHGTIERVK